MKQTILTWVLVSVVFGGLVYIAATTPRVIHTKDVKVIKLTRNITKVVNVTKVIKHAPKIPMLPKSAMERSIGLEYNGKLVCAAIIVRTGVVLTCNHIFQQVPEENITIRLGQSDDETHTIQSTEFTVIKRAVSLDLVLLKCPTPDFDDIELAPDDIPTGTPVTTLGAPRGVALGLASNVGYLTWKKWHPNGIFSDCWLISSAAINGNSGGGVFDLNTGKLVGMTQGIPYLTPYIPIPNVTYIIPITRIKWFLESE